MMVPAPSFFCITQWLPLWRTAANPWARSSSQRDSPEKTLRLGILRLELGDPGLAAEAGPDLTGRGGFKKKINCFPQVGQGGLRGVALAGDIQIWIQGDVIIALLADDGSQAGLHLANFNARMRKSNQGVGMIPSRRRSKEGVSDLWWVEEGYLLGRRGGVSSCHGSRATAVAGVADLPADFGSGDR